MHSYKKFVCVVLILFSAAACVGKRPPVTKPEDALERVSWRKATVIDDQAFRDLAPAVRGSIEYYRKLAPDTRLSFGPDSVTAREMAAALQNFLLIVENRTLSDIEKIEQIKSTFDLYQSVGAASDGKVLFTGYYEPKISCRMSPDASYRYPLYRRPDDIIEVDLSKFGNSLPNEKLLGRLDGKKVIPYYTREEIDRRNALRNRGLEMLWCDDLVDVAILQIQGSGKADLGDGTVLSVLFDGKNGRPYRSLGKYLIESGIIPREDMSLQIIRQYLRDNPDKAADILVQDPSYVFFRLDAEAPSIGNIGVPLTPSRSIATDSRLFPKGALALITTEKPVFQNGAIKEWKVFTRFVVNQDTGGAIKGPGRVDLFWGQGLEAELAAGSMQQKGDLYFLVRKK